MNGTGYCIEFPGSWQNKAFSGFHWRLPKKVWEGGLRSFPAHLNVSKLSVFTVRRHIVGLLMCPGMFHNVMCFILKIFQECFPWKGKVKILFERICTILRKIWLWQLVCEDGLRWVLCNRVISDQENSYIKERLSREIHGKWVLCCTIKSRENVFGLLFHVCPVKWPIGSFLYWFQRVMNWWFLKHQITAGSKWFETSTTSAAIHSEYQKRRGCSRGGQCSTCTWLLHWLHKWFLLFTLSETAVVWNACFYMQYRGAVCRCNTASWVLLLLILQSFLSALSVCIFLMVAVGYMGCLQNSIHLFWAIGLFKVKTCPYQCWQREFITVKMAK